jgi:RNA polymerase sigma-70 factor, ECF subfamily
MARLIAKDAVVSRSFPRRSALPSQDRVEPRRRRLRRARVTWHLPMRALDPQSLTRHTDRLYRAAWALCGSKEDAEDLVQDTFARVLSKPRLIRGDDDLAYLMRVLRNTFFSSRRTASRRPVTSTTLDEVVAADPQPTSQPEHALDVQELYGAVARLPEDFRLALVAVDIIGLSYREAGRALGAREATITTRLFRARRQVVRMLADDPPKEATSQAKASEARVPGVDRAGAAPGARGEDGSEDRQATQRYPPAREGSTPRERLAEQGHL